MPVNHSSSIDKLLDYMPDLIEKTNNMMNRIVSNKKEETEKILKEMQKRNNTNIKQNFSENKKELNNEKQQIKKNIEKVKDDEEIDFEYEYNETEDDD